MQEDIYRNQEADAFFERCKKNIPTDQSIRNHKETIYSMLKSVLPLQGKKVLEVGCFIGDLLNKLRNEEKCAVYGIEPSLKACNYAKDKFNLSIENTTFDKSKFFGFIPENKHSFDVIVAEDVLSWMSREVIMQVLSSLDWCLKPGGVLFLKDYCPTYDFCFRNTHVRNAEVYSYKIAGGHKSFFLMSGIYYVELENITNTDAFQDSKTNRPDSTLWSNSILRKVDRPLHPIISMDDIR